MAKEKKTLQPIEQTPAPSPMQPVKVEAVRVEALNPRTEPLPLKAGVVGLLNKHTARVVYLNADAARSMAKSNPNKFELI